MKTSASALRKATSSADCLSASRTAKRKFFSAKPAPARRSLLKLAAGLLLPDSGSVRVFGRDLASLSEPQLHQLRRQFGFVFQEGALFDSLTVGENVAFRMNEEHVADEEVDERVREALRFVELEANDGQSPR